MNDEISFDEFTQNFSKTTLPVTAKLNDLRVKVQIYAVLNKGKAIVTVAWKSRHKNCYGTLWTSKAMVFSKALNLRNQIVEGLAEAEKQMKEGLSNE